MLTIQSFSVAVAARSWVSHQRAAASTAKQDKAEDKLPSE